MEHNVTGFPEFDWPKRVNKKNVNDDDSNHSDNDDSNDNDHSLK